MYNTKSIQEMAVEFANTMYKKLNQSVASTMGVDVMWFRAFPDKKNQDVIFQTYTLYGVEDCPLQFKAIYSDTNYDEAALTYNIMGISYAIPMSIEVDVATWESVTGNDGTIPQQYDIVYIPLTQKLLEVASMTPIKKMGGQLTGYKLNLSTYKPKRNRVVGENLQESIDENTVSRDSLFVSEIENALKDIVDNHQLDIKDSTPKDADKKITSFGEKITDTNYIKKYNLVVDGHTVSRNYYDLSMLNGVTINYNIIDTFTNKDTRTFSCWLRIHENTSTVKNLKTPLALSEDKNGTYINVKLGTNFKKGDSVIFKRGLIKLPGKVITNNKILVNSEQVKKLSRMNTEWYNVPGFAVLKETDVTLLQSDRLTLSLKGLSFISIKIDNEEKLIQLSKDLSKGVWLGIMIKLGSTFDVDVFSCTNKLECIESLQNIKNDAYTSIELSNPFISPGDCDITNIRLCSGNYKTIDNKIQEFITYHVKNDSKYIINDDAMTFLNKNFMGDQR